MKTIYRVVCSDGSGPYWTDDEVISNIMHGEYNGENHPNPTEDKELCRQINEEGIQVGRYIFAFETPEQLCKWFYDQDTNHELSQHGVKVVECTVNYFVKGDRQIMVHKIQYENRVVVQTLSLYRFVKLHEKELTPA